MENPTNTNKKPTASLAIVLATIALLTFSLTASAQTTGRSYQGHDVTEFIKYQNVIGGSLKCFNYNCEQNPIRAEICNPTNNPLNVDLSKIEPQVLTDYTSKSIIRPVGSIDVPSIQDSVLHLYEPCTQEGYNTNTSQPYTFTGRCQVNQTTTLTTIQRQALLGDFTFTPGGCYNVSIPFRPLNVPPTMNTMEWQLNLTQYPSLALHPFINTDNYTSSFDNTTEVNATVTGYNATIFTNTTGQVLANWTGPLKQGFFANLTSRNFTLDGYEMLARTSYTGGGCPNQGGCAYDNRCNAADDTATWSGSNLGKDWVCINFTKRLTVLYAEIHEDRNDLNIISANYFVTDTRPNETTPFNSNDLIKQQNAQETDAAGCTESAITPIVPAKILAGYFFCANISSMESGANARVGELDVWTANFTPNSRMRSTPITMTKTMTQFRIAANQTLNNGIIGYNISCDGGSTFRSVNHSGFDQTYTCATSGNKLVYEIAIESNTTTNTITPVIERLDLEFFNTSTTASESEARTAIEQGITDLIAAASIHTDQQIYMRYVNGTQRYATMDKYVTNLSKRWIFNYLAGSDQTAAMSNLGTNVYVWENSSLTTTQIRQQVRDLINSTQ